MDKITQLLNRKRRYLEEFEENRNQEEIFHRHTTGKYIGDLIYGSNDGIITTFAIVAGAWGASLPSTIIIILGVANILADGLSMGASNYLGGKSEKDYAREQRKKENWEIDNLRELEIEEVKDIFRKKGFKGEDLNRAVEIITSDRKIWLDTMMRDELGIIEDAGDDPKKHGFVTFLAFITAGSVPLIPFLIPILPNPFTLSIIFAALAMFSVGALRSLVTSVTWIRGGMEMLMVGSTAALVAYLVGNFIEKIIK